MPNDLEVATTPGYEAHASPKVMEVKEKERTPENWPSIWLLLAVSMPRMATNMAWAAQWAALGPYLSTMLPNFAVQLTQIIGPVSGIIVGPSVGVFSDRSTNKFGRRRPFLIIAAFTSIVCWILMGYTREIGDALGDVGSGLEGEVTDRKWTSFFTVFFYIWMDVTVNVVQTPAMLMIADFAGDRQTTGAALGQAWSTFGALAIAGYIEAFGPAYNSMHWFMGMLSIIMAVCVAVACFAAKEKPLDTSTLPKETTWQSIVHAFASIYHGIMALPGVLVAFAFVFFFVCYGNSAYSGNKGQFFGLEVYGGEAEGADACGDNCSDAQKAYNKGVSIAGGRADLLFNLAAYIYAWILPYLVRKFGAKWTITLSIIPQALNTVMAWSNNVTFDVFIVTINGITNTGVSAMITPLIIHMFGSDQEIGVYVGAINSANCFGQLLNFGLGTAIVDTSLGYRLPVFLGGLMTCLGFLTGLFFMKIKMYSM
jgi:solute carrier family 45 protein 1/2/4